MKQYLLSTVIKSDILKKFLTLPAETQAATIAELAPEKQIEAIRKILFEHQLYKTIGLVRGDYVAQALNKYSQNKEGFFKELIDQPFFKSLWPHIARKVTPADWFSDVPIECLRTTLHEKLRRVSERWTDIEHIVALLDEAVIVQFGLSSDDDDILKESEKAWRSASRLMAIAERRVSTKWIIALFKVLAPEVKGLLWASLTGESEAKKLLGLFALRYTPAEAHDHFLEMAFGYMPSREKDRTDHLIAGITHFYTNLKTSVSSIEVVHAVVKYLNCRMIGDELLPNVPISIVQKIIAIDPALSALFPADMLRQLSRKEVTSVELKQLLARGEVSTTYATKIKRLPISKAVELLL